MPGRLYRDGLTAEVNAKGVLDIDVVKGCELGMAANKPNGCYGACYAASIAKFRGIDFSKSVIRRVINGTHADAIVKAVKAAPLGFFRVGTMGDPSHAWDETCELVEWLSPYAAPIIVTKHWKKASDAQIALMVACGAILNTSISALDTPAQLLHRERQIMRYAKAGGNSVARVVSCEFIRSDPLGNKLGLIQDRLLAMNPVIDNPLRAPRTHPLAEAGVIHLKVVNDLSAARTVSQSNDSTYLGHCKSCPDVCGMTLGGWTNNRPSAPQADLFTNK
jgi:hypothetical protein